MGRKWGGLGLLVRIWGEKGRNWGYWCKYGVKMGRIGVLIQKIWGKKGKNWGYLCKYGVKMGRIGVIGAHMG